MNTLLKVIHNGHQLGKAFNSRNVLPLTVIYCITCAGDFHGCYCEDIENCFNCEALQEVEV